MAKAKDHLGNEYKSKAAMCRAYKINEASYDKRISLGWSIKDALTKPIHPGNVKDEIYGEAYDKTLGVFKDHMGNKFQTLELMADAYQIPAERIYKRLVAGWTLKEALTVPIGDFVVLPEGAEYEGDKKVIHISREGHEQLFCGKKCTILGVEFDSIESAAKAYKCSSSTITYHLELGDIDSWISDNVGIFFEDVLYKNKGSIATAYGIAPSTFRGRLNRGWSVSAALKTPVTQRPARCTPCEDHLGNKYETVADMLLYWNMTHSCYYDRKVKGWPLEKILTTPIESTFRRNNLKIK